MKLRNLLLVCAAVIATLSACREAVDYYDPITADEYRQAQYASVFKKVFGEIDPNHNWGFGTSRSRAIHWNTRSVGAYTPTYASAPAVPENAESIQMPNPWNADADPVPATLRGGHSYVINGDEFVLNNTGNNYSTEGDGFIDIYVKSGVVLPEMLNTDNGKVRYFILPGATLTTTKASAGLYNWGTVNQNGLYQYASWNGSANVCEQVIENYGEMNFSGTIQVEGTLYNQNNMSALLKGKGNVYVGGNLDALAGFGLGGKLYVGGEMSGDININIGLDAHVGSINTAGAVTATAGSKLLVEGDVTAPSMKLDGEWGGAVEAGFNGTTKIAGNVEVASNTKASFEKLECANYIANASDVSLGCSLSISGKFELNGNANFTVAAGAFLHVGEANFAANTKMTLYDGAYFLVDGKLQLNNADTNELNGAGTTTAAIVKATTMGANYEDFSNTFTGNIGVEFEAWDYKSSTGLIDKNVNLKTLSGVASNTTLPSNGCSPGYTPPTPPVQNVDYVVYFKYFDENNNLVEFVGTQKSGVGEVGATISVDVLEEITNNGLAYKLLSVEHNGTTEEVDPGTYSFELVNGNNEYTFIYKVPTVPYTVLYFKEGEDTPFKTEEGTGSIGTTIAPEYEAAQQELGEEYTLESVTFNGEALDSPYQFTLVGEENVCIFVFKQIITAPERVPYTVYYKVKNTDTLLKNTIESSSNVGDRISVYADGTLSKDGVDYQLVSVEHKGETSDVQPGDFWITLEEDDNVYTFWYEEKTVIKPTEYTVYYREVGTETLLKDFGPFEGYVGDTRKLVADSEFTVDGKTYELVSDSPYTITLVDGVNEHTFYYRQKVDYTIHYKSTTGEEIRTRDFGKGSNGETVQFAAPPTIEYNGFVYEITQSVNGSLTLDASRSNEYTFVYAKQPRHTDRIIACYRVFAEDLGDMVSDFDFNDIVFDVIHYGNASQDEVEETEIILRAAGGTIYSEILVGSYARYPVHGTFGVADQVMVNTFTSAQGTIDANKHQNRNPVQLASTAANGRYPGHLAPAEVRIFVKDGAAEAYEILSRQGQAAGKVCVEAARPEDLPMWSPEYINIRSTYPKFSDYVKDASVIWWR